MESLGPWERAKMNTEEGEWNKYKLQEQLETSGILEIDNLEVFPALAWWAPTNSTGRAGVTAAKLGPEVNGYYGEKSQEKAKVYGVVFLCPWLQMT